LSADKITILAGQNESGKTSILEALRDFDVDQKISPEAKPDGKDNANPEIICEFPLRSPILKKWKMTSRIKLKSQKK